MRILFVSHTDPFGPFRIGSHHLAAALARAGHDVTHLSTPISVAHLDEVRDKIARLRSLEKELERIATTCSGGVAACDCAIIEALADHGSATMPITEVFRPI